MVNISFTLEEKQEFWADLKKFPDETSKKKLSRMAKDGNIVAGYLLMKNHLEAIFREAMNPLTKEEIAIEMLGELLIAPIHDIRKKAFDLLKKIQPDKISEKLNDEKLNKDLKDKILDMIFSQDEMPLNILVELLRIKNINTDLRDKLINLVVNVRGQIENITETVIKFQNDIDKLQDGLNEKFNIIEQYYQQLAVYGTDFPANPKVLQDLKLDIEMAYETLKETK